MKSKEKPQLANDQFDSIIYSICSYLDDYNFFEISEKLLSFIYNTESIKFKLEKVKILYMNKKYQETIDLCDLILETEKNNYWAWIYRGYGYYYLDNLFDSEESFIKAIRNKPERIEKFEISMLYKLGYTYIKRKTWSDAKVVFSQILKENNHYAFAWRYIGLSYLRLGEYANAEEALNEANLLDVNNESVWGYLTILCLLVERKYQAIECLNEMVKSKNVDYVLLEEIGDLFYQIGEFDIVDEVYLKILKNDPKNINVNIKLSELYFYKIESKKKQSIDYLNRCLEYTDNEKDKKRISDFIDIIKNGLGLTDDKIMTDTNLLFFPKIEQRADIDDISDEDAQFLQELNREDEHHTEGEQLEEEFGEFN